MNVKKMKKDPPSRSREEIAEIAQDAPYYREELYEKEELKEDTRQFIVFRLSREWYGVEISRVKEVIRAGRITYLPSSPEHISGIVSLRGNILPVANLKTVFSLPEDEPTDRQRIIAIESGILEIGFWVDEVVESIDIPVSRIEPALLTLPPEGSKYIEGQCRVGDKLIALISVEKILEKRV